MALVLLVLSALILFGPAVRLLKRALIGYPKAKGACWTCRFDLTGLPSDQRSCPECGAGIVAVGQRPKLPRRSAVRHGLLGFLALQPTLCVVVILYPFVSALPFWGVLAPRTMLTNGSAVNVTPAGMAAARSTLTSFASGSADHSTLEAALNMIVASLSEPFEFSVSRSDDIGPGSNSHLIAMDFDSEDTAALAKLLDNREMPESRYTLLLDALADAYESRPLCRATQVDEQLAATISGAWPRRYGSSSSDYNSPHKTPRALTDEQRARLVEMVLRVQADPTRQWNTVWGHGIEQGLSGAW